MGTISKDKRRFFLLPSSSQLRYAIAYISITAVVLFLLNLYVSATIRNMLFNSQHESLEEKSQLLSTALLQLDDFSSAKVETAINSLDELRITRTVVTDSSATALYDSSENGSAVGKLTLFPEIVRALNKRDVFYARYADGAIESRMAVPVERNGEILGVIYLMEYSTEQGALIDAVKTNVMRISIALEVGIIAISLFFSSAFSTKIRRILHSVRSMREGDYTNKIKLFGHDEIDRLGREFNALAERLEVSEQRRRQFVSDASHELKTPLASIKLLSDSILQNEMDAETLREFIADIGREADRLGRLSQKLLTLTKLDSAAEEDREIVNATEVAQKVLRMLRPLAKLRGIEATLTGDPRCPVMTVEDDLYQILFNLIENAIKYNRDGGLISVVLSRCEGNLILTVADSGIGIPSDALDHVFDRFYRVDKARSRAAGGSGLGLSIVHDMVKRNFGEISVRPRDGGGTEFTVIFPLFETEEGAQ